MANTKKYLFRIDRNRIAITVEETRRTVRVDYVYNCPDYQDDNDAGTEIANHINAWGKKTLDLIMRDCFSQGKMLWMRQTINGKRDKWERMGDCWK
jgi:hypothetical protein